MCRAEKKVQVEEEDSPMEDVSESEDDDIFKKLQKVMDEDDSEAEAEAEADNAEEEEKMEDSDSDLPSDFEREMAVSDEEEEEDEDEEETPDKLNKDIDQHKKELEELKERDPEFYDYLQKEDGDLLGFGESDDAEEEDNDDDDEQEEYSDMEEPEEKIMDDIPVLTKSTLNEWIDAIKSNNDFKTFKKLLSAFKTASRMSEEDDKITFTLKIEDPSGKIL